jgi:hypothetical protein
MMDFMAFLLTLFTFHRKGELSRFLAQNPLIPLLGGGLTAGILFFLLTQFNFAFIWIYLAMIIFLLAFLNQIITALLVGNSTVDIHVFVYQNWLVWRLLGIRPVIKDNGQASQMRERFDLTFVNRSTGLSLPALTLFTVNDRREEGYGIVLTMEQLDLPKPYLGDNPYELTPKTIEYTPGKLEFERVPVYGFTVSRERLSFVLWAWRVFFVGLLFARKTRKSGTLLSIIQFCPLSEIRQTEKLGMNIQSVRFMRRFEIPVSDWDGFKDFPYEWLKSLFTAVNDNPESA